MGEKRRRGLHFPYCYLKMISDCEYLVDEYPTRIILGFVLQISRFFKHDKIKYMGETCKVVVEVTVVFESSRL